MNAQLDSNHIKTLCRNRASFYAHNPAVVEFIEKSGIRSYEFRLSWVASMLVNIVNIQTSQTKKLVLLKSLTSNKDVDITNTNKLITLQAQSSTILHELIKRENKE